jgi:protocatechuate 3,4-dioxygenase beta subunit
MKRRKFIQNSAMAALSIGVFGKIKWDGEKYVGTDPTTTDILGPFYRPGAPFKTDLVQPGTKGELLHFSGTVFGKDGKAVKNALVEIWHCDETGTYDNTSDNYVYRASAKTPADGKYHFKTILPVPYAAGQTTIRPAHIHMRISGNNQTQDLVTQVYFKGDKYIDGDSSSSDPKSLNRILDISKNDKNEKVVKFDIYLKEEYVLEAAAFKKIAGLYEMSNKSMVEFYRDGDQLFAKINGQIMEAMDYKGNNSFEGGLGLVKSQFEILANGGTKVKVSYLGDDKKWNEIDGTKTLKY